MVTSVVTSVCSCLRPVLKTAAASSQRLTWQHRYCDVITSLWVNLVFTAGNTGVICAFCLSNKEEEWGRSFLSGIDSTSSLCTEEEEEEDVEEEETR